MLLLVMALAMVLPIVVSLHYADGAQYALAFSGLVFVALGLLLRNFIGRNASYELRERESFWITAIAWLVVPLAGALPYLFTGALGTFTDAAFESVSGFTTTGSSVIANPAAIPQGMLVWRSITQWIGGLGLILFIVAFLKRLSQGSLQLYSAEFSGTQQRKLHPHIAKSVSRMWRIYSLITLILVLLLVLAGNSVLDSFCLGMSTVSTGGFMPTQFGMSGYSEQTLNILTVFMFLSGVNVALLYNLFTFRWHQLRLNHEFVLYAGIFLFAALSCFVAFSVANGDFSIANLEFSLFHIASTISTCGFYTASPTVWPFWASVVTFLLILTGASAGSTGGGLKLRRLMTLSIRGFRCQNRPQSGAGRICKQDIRLRIPIHMFHHRRCFRADIHRLLHRRCLLLGRRQHLESRSLAAHQLARSQPRLCRLARPRQVDAHDSHACRTPRDICSFSRGITLILETQIA